MKTVVAALHRPTGEIRKARAVGANAGRLSMKGVQERDVANRQVLFDFMTSIWCGAMVGCVGAALIAPQSLR
jgi:hypothetical protein